MFHLAESRKQTFCFQMLYFFLEVLCHNSFGLWPTQNTKAIADDGGAESAQHAHIGRRCCHFHAGGHSMSPQEKINGVSIDGHGKWKCMSMSKMSIVWSEISKFDRIWGFQHIFQPHDFGRPGLHCPAKVPCGSILQLSIVLQGTAFSETPRQMSDWSDWSDSFIYHWSWFIIIHHNEVLRCLELFT